MSDLDRHYDFVDRMADVLTADLLGPVDGPDEVIADEPAGAYLTGVLYPRDQSNDRIREKVAAGDDDGAAPQAASVDEVPDTGVAMTNKQLPMAMGVTFAVDPEATSSLHVRIEGARYEALDPSGEVIRPRRGERGHTDDDSVPRWRRRGFAESVVIPVVGSNDKIDVPGVPGLVLRTRIRPPDRYGDVAVTLTLVNELVAPRGELLDAWSFFQNRMTIATEADVPALVARRRSAPGTEGEVALSELLHRHAPVFATGHGCSVEWDWAPPHWHGARPAVRPAVSTVRTTFVPDQEVLLADSNPAVPEPGMLELADAPRERLLAALDELVDQYGTWIGQRARDATALVGSEHEQAAADQLVSCQEAQERMARGIRRLDEDPDVEWAFRTACRVMAEQRARQAWIRAGGGARPDLAAGRWRPFQIGFILLCIDGIVEPGHPDRDIADVLWFPTGGGKTEAYLGLVAFTTFLRRRRDGAAGGGVTVLMRYTLRLLTLQQFERAATLICAMELVRRRTPELGTEPMAIGMWVGRAATPNTLTEAETGLAKLGRGELLTEKNPVQIRACPWCGTAMDHRNYRVVGIGLVISCAGPDCAFRDGLPIHVVDETIYASRPTLVIATADKFARIAWRADVANVFNRSGAPEGTRPPELIIQDELHLISGPLGSMAGLYETAIDVVAGRPKVVASTATIRRAQEQGVRLFDRSVRQFPPAGIDSRDSWFAVEAPRSRKAARRYMGVLAPATSQATLLIRAYAALLHAGSKLEGDESVRDPYWTLIGYFNSLRLLAAAELQCRADVVERLQQLARRDGICPRDPATLVELTSRKPSSQIPEALAGLSVALPSASAADIVLATNMISVGVDVDRLGLMAVMGQPQTTSEYIQATSRVGRRHPGLVVTMLNSTRSRDRSNYEDFAAFHGALYRDVESTSVTPFAARARDRALHAVLVGLVRMLFPTARDNHAAARIEKYLDEIDEARTLIVERVRRVEPEAVAGTEIELDRFVEEWRRMAEDNPDLVYEARRPPPTRGPDDALLRAFAADDDLENAFDTLWSLRDVDVETDLRVSG